MTLGSVGFIILVNGTRSRHLRLYHLSNYSRDEEDFNRAKHHQQHHSRSKRASLCSSPLISIHPFSELVALDLSIVRVPSYSSVCTSVGKVGR